jgi:hypothetical protein
MGRKHIFLIVGLLALAVSVILIGRRLGSELETKAPEIPWYERSAPGIGSIEDRATEPLRGASGRPRGSEELRRESGTRIAGRTSCFVGRTVHSMPPLGG